MNRESIQKWIIITAVALGIIISTGGLAYRHLFANQPTNHPSPVKTTTSQASLTYSNNFYAKIKSSQPVNILFLGEDNSRNQRFLDEFTKDLDVKFSSKSSVSMFTTLIGTSWSNLMALHRVQQTQQPDLVLLCSGANDEKTLSPEQYKALFEATIQTLGQKYPHAEIMLMQEPSLNAVTVEIHRKLARHYNLPLLALEDPNKPATAQDAPIEVIQEKLKTNATTAQIANKEPLWDIVKYQNWQQLQTYTEIYDMEESQDAANPHTLVGSKEGALVESIFNGRGIGVSVQCGPDGGVARVYLDGQKHNSINTYSPEPGVQHILLADNLEPGEHRIKVIVLGYGKHPSTGSKIVLEGFDVME